MEKSIIRTRFASVLLAAFAISVLAAIIVCSPSAYAASPQTDGASLKAAQADLSAQAELSAQAATKSVKNCDFTTTTKTINKKALKVKKGTTKLSLNSGQGYIRFIAPKTKTYSFTFSNLKSKKSSYGLTAFVEFQTPDKSMPQYSFMMRDVATQGGKTSTLWLASKEWNGTSKKLVDKPLKKRTGKVKLTKGTNLYLYFSSVYKYDTVTLKVS